MPKFRIAFVDAGANDIYKTEVYADGFVEALKEAYKELTDEKNPVAGIVMEKPDEEEAPVE